MINAGERILEILNEKNMTQYMLAKRIGMTPSSINTIIRKSNSPRLNVVERICEGLGVTVGYFMKEESVRGDLDAEGVYDFYEEICENHCESKCSFLKCKNREQCFEDIKKEIFKK